MTHKPLPPPWHDADDTAAHEDDGVDHIVRTLQRWRRMTTPTQEQRTTTQERVRERLRLASAAQLELDV